MKRVLFVFAILFGSKGFLNGQCTSSIYRNTLSPYAIYKSNPYRSSVDCKYYTTITLYAGSHSSMGNWRSCGSTGSMPYLESMYINDNNSATFTFSDSQPESAPIFIVVEYPSEGVYGFYNQYISFSNGDPFDLTCCPSGQTCFPNNPNQICELRHCAVGVPCNCSTPPQSSLTDKNKNSKVSSIYYHGAVYGNNNLILVDSSSINILEVSTNAIKNNGKIIISPNPSNDFLLVDGLVNVISLRLINLHGQILQTYSISAGSIQQKLDVAQYTNGLYYLQMVKNNGEIKTEKITVSH